MAAVLVGDIGGTNARLQLVKLEMVGSEVLRNQTYHSASYPSLLAIVQEFLRDEDPPKAAVLAVAGAIIGNSFDITNVKWASVSTADIEQACGIANVKFINDFEAAGYGVLELMQDDVISINSTALVDPSSLKAVIGPGTGLGECILTPVGDGLYRAWPSEGGHSDFGPKNELEWRYTKFIM